MLQTSIKAIVKSAYKMAAPLSWRKSRYIRRLQKELDKFPIDKSALRHSLPGPLVVSLTSYPARFPTLHYTLKCLLDQTVKPDAVILWIANEDFAKLPIEVLTLLNHGLSIEKTEDIRNFKKIIPTLRVHADDFIITVDDDTYYPSTLVSDMVKTYDPLEPSIVCFRAHEVLFLSDGSFAPYADWPKDVQDETTVIPSRRFLPTGNGGVMYPPGSLPNAALDISLIQKLSPTSDDVWLFFMWQRAGWKLRRVPGKRPQFTSWPSTQDANLTKLHMSGLKDKHLSDMLEYFSKDCLG